MDQNKDIRLVVLQRGLILIGHYSRQGMNCFLKKSVLVKKWDFTSELGKLADGHVSGVVFEKVGDVEFHRLNEIMAINLKACVWDNKLEELNGASNE